jgi:uncharacterized repeat protein (TIGR02543 family)
MLASAAYDQLSGHWDDDPATVAITEATTFTYSFDALAIYMVTYKIANGTWSDGTSVDKTESVLSGSSPSEVPVGMLAGTGYDQNPGAWDSEPSEYGAVTGDVAFMYAFATLNTYTVTFDHDDGETDLLAVEVEHGMAVEAPVEPERLGYDFLGWYLGGDEYDFMTPVTGNLTLTARWVEEYTPLDTYTVAFDFNDGETDSLAVEVEEGSLVEAPEVPDRYGYSFLGWYLGDDRYDFDEPVMSDLELTAYWQLKTYTVVFDSNGGSPVVSQTIIHGGTVTEPEPIPTRNGYTFKGWHRSGLLYDFDAPVTSGMTLTASWEKIVLYGDVNDDGIVTPADATLLALYLMGLDGLEINILAADVNVDNNVTPGDFTLLMLFLSGVFGDDVLPIKQ